MEFNFKKEIKNALIRCCVYFTVVTSVSMLIYAFSNANFVASDILFLLLFSVLLAVAGVIRAIKKMHIALRVVIHYAIFIFATYTCMFLPYDFKPSPTMVGLVLVTLVYAIVGVIIAIFTSRLRTRREQNEAYKQQLKGNFKNKK